MNQDELIAKFLDNELTNDEKNVFDSLYQSDPVFKKSVDIFLDLKMGVREAGKNRILKEVLSIKESFLIENDEFEEDIKKALQLKNREKISNELKELQLEKMKKTQSKIIYMNMKKVLSIAASLLLLLVSGWFIYNQMKYRNINQSNVSTALNAIQNDAQKSGIADPDREYKVLLDSIFVWSNNDQIEKALIENDRLYRNKSYDYKYFETKGIIYLKNKEWAKAEKAFTRAVQSGDSCLSKVLLAVVKNETKNQKQAIIINCGNNALASEILNGLL